jgi:hypothetical protein
MEKAAEGQARVRALEQQARDEERKLQATSGEYLTVEDLSTQMDKERQTMCVPCTGATLWPRMLIIPIIFYDC